MEGKFLNRNFKNKFWVTKKVLLTFHFHYFISLSLKKMSSTINSVEEKHHSDHCPVSLSLIMEPSELESNAYVPPRIPKSRKLKSKKSSSITINPSKKRKLSSTTSTVLNLDNNENVKMWSFDSSCPYPILPQHKNESNKPITNNVPSQSQPVTMTTNTHSTNSTTVSSSSPPMQFCKSHIVNLMLQEGRVAVNVLEILGTLPVDKYLYAEMRQYAYQCSINMDFFERLLEMAYHRPVTWKLCHLTCTYFEFWYRHVPTFKINWKIPDTMASMRLFRLITISLKNNDFFGFRAFFKCQPLSKFYTPQIWVDLFQKHCNPYTDVQILELILKNIEIHFHVSKLTNEKIDTLLFPYEKWFDWNIATQLQSRGIDKRVLKRGLPETYYQMIYVLFKDSTSPPPPPQSSSESIAPNLEKVDQNVESKKEFIK